MKHNVVAPAVGESITEVSILKWTKKSGDLVKKGEILLELESDKATVEIIAEADGVLSIEKAEGERIPIGAVVGNIDDSAKPTATASAPAAAPKTAPPPGPAVSTPPPAPIAPGAMPVSPAVRKIATEQGVDLATIAGTGKDGRVTKGDLLQPPAAGAAPAVAPKAAPSAAAPAAQDRPGDRRVKMSRLRMKIAERLVSAQHEAALLTTFNEVDMSAINAVRAQHKEPFKAKHLSSTVGSEAWNSRDLKSRPH